MSDTLFTRFRETADRHPAAIAIDFGDQQVSYAELTSLVAGSANAIASIELPPQSRIGLLATREPATYVAYLAILRLGHVVVPLGADNPVSYQRMVAALADLDAAIVPPTTHTALADALAADGIQVLSPIGQALDVDSAPVAEGRADDIAYILFTSGSTGQPKGVPIKHASVCSYLDHVVPWYEVRPGARLSHTFAMTFDPSIFDLFASWTGGATLVVPRKRELLSPTAYVRSRRLTHWYSVPSLISYARRAGKLPPGSMPDLRWSKFIGEQLTLDLARMWWLAAPASALDNVYGPTELTIACSGYRLPADVANWPQTSNGTVPIGRLYPHLEALVMRESDDSGEGELCVRGVQRFGGYLDPSANAGRFIRNIDHGVFGVSDQLTEDDWYRTGDRITLLKDDWVHLGRIDRQIKAQGFRIELDEVEAVIRGHPAVDDAAVVEVRDQQADRVALFAAVCGKRELGFDLADFLRARLPVYMVPSTFRWLDHLPVNHSGKIDFSAVREMAQPS